MKNYVVEIADENDGFVVVEANSEEEAEAIAEMLGYEVMYAHEEEL